MTFLTFGIVAAQNGVMIEHHLHVGDVIREYHTNLDGCGYVVATDFEVEDAKEKAEAVRKIIDENIERL